MRKYDNIPRRNPEMAPALQGMTAEVPAMALSDFIRKRTTCLRKAQLHLDANALHLISQMLTWDPSDRITAAAAVRHRLFRSVVRRASNAGAAGRIAQLDGPTARSGWLTAHPVQALCVGVSVLALAVTARRAQWSATRRTAAAAVPSTVPVYLNRPRLRHPAAASHDTELGHA